jgi:heavy metal translocating P-type ATPase
MSRWGTFARKYPWVIATAGVGLIGLALWSTPASGAVPWIVGGFAATVAFIQGIGMVKALLARHVGLDILAVTAILATLAVGEYWASIIIVLMLTGGEALEDAAANRAQRQLKALLTRIPQLARRINSDGSFTDIAVSDVVPGDRILVRPSEIFPVDATLQSPGCEVDESSLTGESLPVERFAGDTILSGTINGQQAVEILAAKRAEDSEYQAIIRLVEQAAASKAPLVRLADRYAVPFTLLAYAIAAVAWWASGDPVRFAEVLVVATPCPLLIAAPVAFMGGMSRASTMGVVIKDAGTLERLSRVRTVAFDKTGTLTRGAPEVVRTHVTRPNLTPDMFLSLVGSAEQYSTHVHARAIVASAKHLPIPLHAVTEAEEVATDGVRATVASHKVVVGKARFVSDHTTPVESPWLSPGETAVFVGIDGRFAGYIVLRDTLRDEARDTITRLTAAGITRTVMVTGDNAQTANHVAAELGISDVYAECLPGEKVDIVASLHAASVMMVGDGVNDAPVLAAAGVGVAMGARGATAASESADVVILVDTLDKVADAVEVGHRTVNVALQSIWLGIVISVGLMMVAAFGFLPAIFGALAQEVVDLVAILGALRALKPARKRSVSHQVIDPELASTR